jgi:hypothetical protein
MNKLPLLAILTLLLSTGCATKKGRSPDGNVYYQYDIRHAKDSTRFYVPLGWVEDEDRDRAEKR